MIVQYFIAGTFWLSYLAITFASVITIADFVQKAFQSRVRKSIELPPEVENDSVKLHISGGLLEVDHLSDKKEES